MIYKIPLNSLEDTQNIATLLAPLLPSKGNITITGTLGAGKTTFVAYLIQEIYKNLGQTTIPDVTSPTFSIIHEYDLTDRKIAHCDLFRLDHPCELEEIGFEEYQENALCLIEWPENGGDYLHEPILQCDFMINAHNRILTLTLSKGYSLDNEKFNDYLVK